MGRDTLAWGLLLCGLVGVVLAPLLLGTHTLLQHDIGLSDLHHILLGYRATLGRSLAAGELPLWNPDVLGGTPLAAQIEAGAWYPPNWSFALLSPGRALALVTVWHAQWAALGAFALARWRGVSRPGALLVGLAFALCGTQISHLKHPSLHEAMCWLPWIWWLAEASWAHRRAVPWLAAAVALQALAGHPQLSLYSLMGVCAVTARWGWVNRERWGARGSSARALRVALAIGCGAGLAALQWLPTWSLSSQGLRAGGGTLEFLSYYRFNFWDLLTLVSPWLTGSPYACDYTYWQDRSLPWEGYAYFGVIPLALAVAGGWRRTGAQPRAARAGLGLALWGSLVLALSNWTPLFAWLVDWLPGFGLFRFPQRFLILAQLALALFAGFGWDRLREALAGRLPEVSRRALGAGVVALVVLDLALLHRPRLAWVPLDAFDGSALAALMTDQAREQPGLPQRLTNLDAETLWKDAHLEGHCVGGRSDALRALAAAPIYHNTALHGIESWDGAINLAPLRTVASQSVYSWPRMPGLLDSVEVIDGGLDPRHLRRLVRSAVTHVFSRRAIDQPGLERVADLAGQGVYRVADVQPRASVHADWRVMGRNRARWQLDDPDPRPALERAPPRAELGWADSARSGVAPVLERTANSLSVDVSGLAGVLVVAEGYGPGWTASVDGRPAPVFPANGIQRAVLVPPDSSRVDLTYWPPGQTLGLSISAGALCVWFGLWLWSRREPRSQGAGG